METEAESSGFDGLEEAFEEGRKALFKKPPKTVTTLIKELGAEYQDPKNWTYAGITTFPECPYQFDTYQHVRDKSAKRHIRRPE